MRLCRDRDSAPSTKLDDVERQEAERKLQELKRRRNDAESEELEKMKQKQQDAEAELEKLKRKREERRKIMEEEERQRKQELEDKKTREQVRDGPGIQDLIISTFIFSCKKLFQLFFMDQTESACNPWQNCGVCNRRRGRG